MTDLVMELTGLDEMVDTISQMARAAGANVTAALRKEAERIMTEVKENRVPVDTGALRASGIVTDIEGGVELGFGNNIVDYAIPVHENLFAHHTVGEAKYLENGINAALPSMSERIARDLDASLRNKGR